MRGIGAVRSPYPTVDFKGKANRQSNISIRFEIWKEIRLIGFHSFQMSIQPSNHPTIHPSSLAFFEASSVIELANFGIVWGRGYLVAPSVALYLCSSWSEREIAQKKTTASLIVLTLDRLCVTNATQLLLNLFFLFLFFFFFFFFFFIGTC